MSAGYWQLLKGKSSSPSTFPHGIFPLATPVSELAKETCMALGPAESNVGGTGQCHASRPGRSLQLHTQCSSKSFNFGFNRTLHFSLLRPKSWKYFVNESRHCAERKSGD